MLRFDRNELEQHADAYCAREAKLANDLTELLRCAASCAPAGMISRTIRIMNDADRLASYFAAMRNALYDAGEAVDAASMAVLERLEASASDINRLLY